MFPSQIEEVISETRGVGEGWQIVIEQPPDALDKLYIVVEADPVHWDREEEVERIGSELSSHVQSRLGIGALIEVKAPSSLPRYEGKAKRVIDRRKEKI